MLRFTRRWHDAANGPLTGEARLLWFATPPTPPPAAPTPPDDDAERERLEREERERAAAEARRVDAQREFHHRKAREMLRDGSDLDETPPKTADLVARTTSMQEELRSLGDSLDRIEGRIREHDKAKRAVGEDRLAEIRANGHIFRQHADRMDDYLFMLREELNLEAWERGDVTPSAFLARYETHIAHMGTIDEADASLTTSEREERAEHRRVLLAAVREAVAEAKRKKPEALPMNDVPDASEEEMWNLFDSDEKKNIIKDVSAAAGIDDVKLRLHDDVESIAGELQRKQLADKLLAAEKAILNATAEHAEKTVEGPEGDASAGYTNPLTMIRSAWKRVNDAAGIEYMTVFEMIDACKEVIEGVKELRKQKSRLRVSRAASRIGHVVSLVPGMGGKALEALLDQQQEAKNDEIKEGFIKELKSNRNDPGFPDLFGDGRGKAGLLTYYHQIGDTNRTRAILEFAAGKAMLYTTKGEGWKECIMPGNIPFRDLMPKEWTDKQIDTYYGNLQFANKQGEDSQIKAGEDFVAGKAKFEDYTGVFEGAVKNLSLWFAKGVANKALQKVKEGEMSTTLTLIVAEQWETNPLFRQYMDWDWMDRLSGDSKQLMIGMIKYDKGHLLEGAQGNKNRANITYNIAKAHEDGKDGKQRLGPLIAATRQYLKDKDPSLDPDRYSGKNREDVEKELRKFTAQVLACKTVTLSNGEVATFYSTELRPHHIKYDPNEMRDAAVDKIGDDFFIERSEIINCSVEVAQYVLRLRDNGFDQPTKARYFLSHIIDAYDELANEANRGNEEFRQALANFTAKQRENLNPWIERALGQPGASVLLTEQHKNQDGRKLVLTLLRKGLISVSSVERIAADDTNAGRTRAKQLLQEYYGSGAGQANRRSRRQGGQPGAAPAPSTAA